MVTLALFGMCGLMGLAVDLGWAYFVKRSAQTAADAAAMAAAQQVLDLVGPSGTFACGPGIVCQASGPCPSTVPSPPGTNLELGCLYAQRNGFAAGGKGGRQNVIIEASAPPAPCRLNSPPDCVPTAPGVAAYYWVSVQVTESIPQLFSAVLGNQVATVNARATAAIAESVTAGSLILTNRQNDDSPVVGRGVNLSGDGNPVVSVPGGTMLASTCGGANCDGNYAGKLQGAASVTSPFTFVRNGGAACAGNIPGCTQVGQSQWIAPYNNRPDGSYFYDPMSGKGQPPLTTQTLPGWQVLGGVIWGGTASSPTVVAPGNFYATAVVGCPKNCKTVATGGPIILGSGHFQFVSCPGCAPGSGFGDYIFWGGLAATGGSATITLNPGRYVFAGQSGGEGGALLFLSNGTALQDYTRGVGQNSDPGEILIFTDTNYPGLDIQLRNLPLVSLIRSQLQYGVAGFTMGQSAQSSINLHGLNDRHPLIHDTPLERFSPVVIWQDQANSAVKYLPDGKVDASCGDLDNPCSNPPLGSLSRAMNLQATPGTHLYGTVYQPRGAWVNLQGGGGYAGPLQLVSGALNLQGGPDVTLTSLPNPMTTLVVALVA